MKHILFVCEFESKQNMYQLFANGNTSDDFKEDSKMYLAMIAYEHYGNATRDNSFEDLVQLGKDLEKGDEK